MATAILAKNLASAVSHSDIHSFLSHCGDVKSIDLQTKDQGSKTAYILFHDSKSVEQALLLSGSELCGQVVTLELGPRDYVASETAKKYAQDASETSKQATDPAAALKKAEEMMKSLLAKGYILGQDALARAKAFDEKHALTTKAAAQAERLKEGAIALGASAQSSAAKLDEKYAISARLAAGSEQLSNQLSEVDERLQMSEKTRSVFEHAEKKISEVGSYMLQNKYVAQGRDWVMGVAAAVSDYVEGDSSHTSQVTAGPGIQGDGKKDETAKEVTSTFETPALEGTRISPLGDLTTNAPGGAAEPLAAKAHNTGAPVGSKDSDMPVF